jgi:tetratricopeptide (TPR) repeat protein
MVDYFPTKKFMVTYDSAALMRTGNISPEMVNRLDTIRWEIKAQAVEKANLMIMDLLATNNWKRPVYFVMTTGADTYIGLDKYFHLEGLAYRLLPVQANAIEGQIGEVNTAIMYDNLMNRFKFGNMNKPGVYIDETNARMVMNFRGLYGRLADALISEGKLDSAKKVLDRSFEMMPESVVPYDYFTVPLINGYYRAGETARANAIAEKLYKNVTDDLAYFFSFPDKDLKSMDMSIQEAVFTLQRLGGTLKEAKQDKLQAEAEAMLKKYYDLYVEKVYQP